MVNYGALPSGAGTPTLHIDEIVWIRGSVLSQSNITYLYNNGTGRKFDENLIPTGFLITQDDGAGYNPASVYVFTNYIKTNSTQFQPSFTVFPGVWVPGGIPLQSTSSKWDTAYFSSGSAWATTNYANSAIQSSANNILASTTNLVQTATNSVLKTATNSFDALGAAQAATNNFGETIPVNLTNAVNQFAGVFTGNGSGLTNLIPWSLSASTNVSVTFNGSLREMTLTNQSGVNFTNFTGTAGSYSFLLYSNVPVTYGTNVFWLTTHPATVTNGVISFTAYGSQYVGAYIETQ